MELATEKQKNYIKVLDPNFEIKEDLNIREASIIIHKLKNKKPIAPKKEVEKKQEEAPKLKDYARQKELKKAWIKSYYSGSTSSRDEAYWIKHISYVLELNDGRLCMFEKPYLDTSFCFGYGFCGVSSQEEEDIANSQASYAEKDATYFINENLKEINQDIALTEQYIYRVINGDSKWYEKYGHEFSYYHNILYFCGWERTDKKACELAFKSFDYNNKLANEFTNLEDLNNVLEVLKNEKKKMEKRLQTYLKKYGLEKLHVWTYLVD